LYQLLISSGQSTQPYKYNGKEFIEMHGYDTYDYGFRGYYTYLAQVSQLVPNVFFKVINLEVVDKQKVLTDLYQLGLFRTQSQNIFT
jgi:hypothetical protein